jgi:hypothetical protein
MCRGFELSTAGGASYFVCGAEDEQMYARLHDAIMCADTRACVLNRAAFVRKQAPKLHRRRAPPSDYWQEASAVRAMLEATSQAAGSSDVVVAYLPTLSMSCAVELQEARQCAKLVLVVSADAAVGADWAVRANVDRIFASIDDFSTWLRDTRYEWRRQKFQAFQERHQMDRQNAAAAKVQAIHRGQKVRRERSRLGACA